MKKQKLFLIIALLLVPVLLIPADITRTEAMAAQTKVSINKTSATLIKGQTLQLKISGASKNITWSSSDNRIATVSSTGKVTTKAKGTVNITAKVSGKKYTCKVKVEIPQLDKTKLTLDKGKTSVLKVFGTTSSVKWSSSNKKIATVTSAGKVTAVKKGTCKIYATISGKKYTCSLTVQQKVTSVKLNYSKYTLKKAGSTVKLNTTVSPSDANNKALTWSSSNTKVAKVDTSGKVTAVSAGTATITAKAKDGSGKKATCKITVTVNKTSSKGK